VALQPFPLLKVLTKIESVLKQSSVTPFTQRTLIKSQLQYVTRMIDIVNEKVGSELSITINGSNGRNPIYLKRLVEKSIKMNPSSGLDLEKLAEFEAERRKFFKIFHGSILDF
jgi:hypothetical protein